MNDHRNFHKITLTPQQDKLSGKKKGNTIRQIKLYNNIKISTKLYNLIITTIILITHRRVTN